MKIGQIDIPEPLLEAQREGTLVIFAGAGVSMPAPSDYPNFEKLAERIAAGSSLTREEHEPLEHFLGRLENQGVRVHRLARELLASPSSKPNQLHYDLLKLFDFESSIRLVTTNFDAHFTTAVKELFGAVATIFDAPALPLGDGFEGLIYLHGSVERKPEQLVLTDGDFGRAYLTEGWARRFLQAMFARYTVLFVGYSHSDMVMNYLARGLPPDTQGQRYALTHESDPGKWRLLGIYPIVYPLTEGPSEHVALSECLARWVDVARMGVLDHENKIREITRLPPPLEPEDADYIENTLRDPVTARFFARHAKGIEWLHWAESKSSFRELFGSIQAVDDVSRILAYWFAENFACEHPEEALSVIQRRGQQLNPVLWEALANIVAQKLGGEDRPDGQTVAKWIAILLGSLHTVGSSDLLDYLLDRCRYPEDNLTALLLFEHLTSPRSRLERGLGLPGMRAPREQIEMEGELYLLRESWEKLFKPNLAAFAESLELILVGHLQRAHLLLHSVGEADDIWDPLTSSRPAIEPHEQNFHDTGVDLLVDAARDTLEWMLENKPERAKITIETWISHASPLLRRIAVHGVAESATLHPDEKIDWMLQNALLYGYGPKHEVFRLLTDAYQNASKASRQRVLERSLLGPQGGEARSLEESDRQYDIYNLLAWLHQVAPECSLTTECFEKFQQEHQDEFEAREHPDLYSYTTHLAPTKSPISVEELLDQDPTEMIGWLLSYQGESGAERVTRRRLLETASQGVAQSYQYGQGLSTELLEREAWNSDLWTSIIEGWREGNLSEEQWKEVLGFLLEHPELYQFAHEISDLLQNNANGDENGTVPSSCIPLAETLAERVYDALRDQAEDTELNGNDSWLGKAINHPGGKLTELWLLTLSRKRTEAGDDWCGLSSEHQQYLNKVLTGETYAAQLGRVVLASQLFFLFSSDADWTRQHVLPLLDWSRDERSAEQAWHGFLSWGRWSEALLPDLLPLYEGAFASVTGLPQTLRRQFSRHLASIAIYGPNDPIQEGWLGRFLIAVEIQDRADWALDAGFMMRQLEEEAIRDLWEQWLGEYWSQRLEGMPIPLAPEELEKMADWSFRLDPVFPEVAQRIRESPPSAIRYSRRFLPQLAESGYASRYPQAVAELLRYLLPHATQPFWHCEQAAALVRELVQHTSVRRPVLDQICNELGALGCPNAAELRGLVG